MRAREGLPSFRGDKLILEAVRGVLAEGHKRAFRVVHFSIQSNHLLRHEQVPPRQDETSMGHTVPQLPQLALSVSGSAQPPSQRIKRPGQLDPESEGIPGSVKEMPPCPQPVTASSTTATASPAGPANQ
jgi:hypothetical protein